MSTTPPTPPRRPTGTFGHGEKPTDTRSLVQQIMAEQKEQKQVLREAINKSEKRFPLGPVAAGVLLVANLVVWLVFPPTRQTQDLRKPAEVERDLRLVVASAASEIEVWRRTHGGGIPKTLTEAGVKDAGLTFRMVDSTMYEIKGTERGAAVTYRSNTAINDFLDAGLGPRK